jgi:hypothetical protein
MISSQSSPGNFNISLKEQKKNELRERKEKSYMMIYEEENTR